MSSINLNKLSRVKPASNLDDLTFEISEENADKYLVSNSTNMSLLIPSKKLNQKSLSGLVSYPQAKSENTLNSVDFNLLTEKLKLIQNNGYSLIKAPTPSNNLPTKASKLKKTSSSHQQTNNNNNSSQLINDLIDTERISLKLKTASRKEFQRSLSTMESHKLFENVKQKIVANKSEKFSGCDRSQSQLNYSNACEMLNRTNNHEPIYEELKEESVNCYSKSCEVKNKADTKRVATNRHMSMMSLRSGSPMSSSAASTRSETDSASLSCSPRSSSNSPHRHFNMDQIKKNAETFKFPVNGAARSIVIRRDKSVSVESSKHGHLKRAKEEEHLIMKQNLLASIANSKSNSSATTSGVETVSKNSSNAETIMGSADNLNLECQKINELKNRLFITEIELGNERKKLGQEKELKKKLVTQLKARFETEKAAALKALEAKLSAEKLFELNKLKELFEFEKREEADFNQKSFDSELLSLKLKLRDKAEKCSQLERQLHEEQFKNGQLYTKSVELVHRYNQEIKILSDKQHLLRASLDTNQNKRDAQLSHAQTLIDNEKSLAFKMAPVEDKSSLKNESEPNNLIQFKQQLLNIYSILSSTQFSLKSNLNPNEANLGALFFEIQSLAKSLTKLLNDFKFENKSVKEQNEKFNSELKNCQETKLKLEALYKIKCKSDLNKSAQIKKCQLNYEMELMKFKNEFNCDLVRHLENQLSIKESQLFEQKMHMENLNNLVNDLSELESNLNAKNKETCLAQIKQSIKHILKSFTSNELRSWSISLQTANVCLSSNFSTVSSFKKVPVNVLFVRENEDFKQVKKSDEKQQQQIEKTCNEKNKKLQEELSIMDRQLNEMKILNKKLTREKEELNQELKYKEESPISTDDDPVLSQLEIDSGSPDNHQPQHQQSTSSTSSASTLSKTPKELVIKSNQDSNNDDNNNFNNNQDAINNSSKNIELIVIEEMNNTLGDIQ